MFHDQGTMQPPTEKVHQIIARTALFVCKHGGQSEIVLRVKQGDNPTFGFLMPDHHLHAYFRYLVDHPELLKSDMDAKPQEDGEKADNEQNQTGDVAAGALSLLGSVYGTGEDEDTALHAATECKEKELGESLKAADTTISHDSKEAESCGKLIRKEEETSKCPLPAIKEKAPSSKRNRLVTTINAGTSSSRKKEGDVLGSHHAAVYKAQASNMPSTSKAQSSILEPPSDLKRMVDKIVEFILKNGKEFESVLIEQDSQTGRFPFLLSSNQYHPYYLKALQKAQESKLPGKSPSSQMCDLKAASKDKDKLSKGSSSHDDIPFDFERKERFKMVIGGPKKDVQDISSKPTLQPSGVSVDAAEAILLAATRGLKNAKLDILAKSSLDSSRGLGGECKPASSFGSLSSSQVQSSTPKPIPGRNGVSVDAAEAILLAATRGLRNPKLDILPKTSVDDSGRGSAEDGQASSLCSLSSRARSSTPKSILNGDPSFSMPIDSSQKVDYSEKEGSRTSDVSVAKAIAKTAALAAASEADSSEACLTREQKQKAERLKRAKMFAAMIKSGKAPHSKELLPRLSAEPPDSAHSGLLGSGCKGSVPGTQVPLFSNHSGEEGDIVDREREGSSVPLDAHTSNKMDGYEKKEPDDDHEDRRLRKKQHSKSRRHEEDDNDGEERDHKHSRKKHRSHHPSHREERKHRKRHSSPSCKESRHRHKHHSSSEDEHRHRSRNHKHRGRSHSERTAESEDDEISASVSADSNTVKIGGNATRETSLGLSTDPPPTGETPSNTRSSDTTEVPDELRAKVRAMLLATM
ncbi:PREDICTED: splicing factor, suppressor of white-apricot homolog isoform X2 [Nelumbo nucifera]|uniref:Splicing factor, suppressor of white-apricot homolog isoform X2 n=1 Tax=Nelumbo nucifera TaxID=4432 RepID=A0A1U8Q1P0_NELNU|nr:PREDICTED: splicing factor, suppressor of white-apricot homolog isoform X2 [Nelumbo nucifera]XP_019052735.1 PREDICTED: splicing factor, suppressor of white-apricot homolog isoform X2 [Nelumbo nucifera]XP_019052736.1 PREDICTED: splicing factor, suppressor of white-apricot homolog isoform X2 [Nelumbo nucifera]